ncbi:MAG: 16S rRNA (cytosine(1402)-N(4))-methyltransferase RsmH [Robiginitomaculum sp.]|nr:16S rRNA (cytosine(1402)-N(4))-methyltransferase RsmH [Robiginitomaculum sp.]
MSHTPVLLDEVLAALSPGDSETIIDGTFGAGGYSAAILRAANCKLVGLDRDPRVGPHVERLAAKFGERFSFVQAEFSGLDQVTSGAQVDGVVLDIGVSSMQLDEDLRGFSFMRDGPLDMRMSSSGPSAADAVKYMSRNDLERIFKVYGEERRARRCADFIVRARDENPVETTGALADILTRALGQSGKRHPATRVFQALRIFINDELGELVRGLLAAERILKPGGRLVVVSFHSLEDRIVKSFLRRRSGEVRGGSRHLPPQSVNETAPSFVLKKRSGVSAGKDELRANPRARSARLRAGVRTDAEPWSEENNLLPVVPGLDVLEGLVA